VKTPKPEFDQYSESYSELLHDPIRDRFAPGGIEFFHTRKRDVILSHFASQGKDTRSMAHLDLGCGKGELVLLLQKHFSSVAGCDPSSGMLKAAGLESKGIETRVQEDPGQIPFNGQTFDFVTAVCVFHHVPPAARLNLLKEMRRVMKPGGTLSIIEHNPYNPVTKLIVSRTPVDADAILLRPGETRSLLQQAGFSIADQRYFLYFPESLYARLSGLESALEHFPLGGQYAVFGRLEK